MASTSSSSSSSVVSGGTTTAGQALGIYVQQKVGFSYEPLAELVRSTVANDKKKNSSKAAAALKNLIYFTIDPGLAPSLIHCASRSIVASSRTRRRRRDHRRDHRRHHQIVALCSLTHSLARYVNIASIVASPDLAYEKPSSPGQLTKLIYYYLTLSGAVLTDEVRVYRALAIALAFTYSNAIERLARNRTSKRHTCTSRRRSVRRVRCRCASRPSRPLPESSLTPRRPTVCVRERESESGRRM